MRRSLIAAVIVLLVAAALWTMWRTTQREVVRAITKPHEEQVDLGVLVTRVRELNRLETASMHVVHVGTISQSYTIIPNAIGGDAITLYSAGDVFAGIDLGQMQPNDVWREPDGTIVMRLPEAQVLVTRLDNRETHVVSRQTGMLRRADPGLEGRARQYAEQSIRREALNRGIIELARTNGENKLAQLLRTLGAPRVRFLSRPASPSPH